MYCSKWGYIAVGWDIQRHWSAQDPDPLDPQDFGFLDPDPQKYADPRIRIQGGKYQPKTAKKKNLILKLKSEGENIKIS